MVVGILFFIGVQKVKAQNYDLVKVTAVVSGNETNNTLFTAESPTIPELAYIRAQRISGPQDGLFMLSSDNIRYISASKNKGIPDNLSRIRFTFLRSDRRTFIPLSNFRFIINDIDGPNNESLATSCDDNVRFVGTSNPTHLIVENEFPVIRAIGTLDENDGATSRVMFQFYDVAIVEFDNYANYGYLKDFDINNDYPISKPLLTRCRSAFNLIHQRVEKEASIRTMNKSFLVVKTNPIYFDKDKYNIRKDAEKELEKVVRTMLKYPQLKIEVRSHTDSRAPDDYNIVLSDNRAKSTVNWIVNKGIDSTRITGKGFGETLLVNHCSNGVECHERLHQLNRRTEFVILNPQEIK